MKVVAAIKDNRCAGCGGLIRRGDEIVLCVKKIGKGFV